ncbi:anti-sigma factor [Kangiella sediminilitoris]|uniref:Transmembrane anti-sigma factor n=1 Tax=Kangiella sediminilitoris TaxID=1144748 RepID=A0A1B3B7J0_9GAMM|nr:hypothetical protein [Kangiella sediminilitoris]AOE48757.1 hypothetical protein KS2013_25 [Kangiella sediminilitoris]
MIISDEKLCAFIDNELPRDEMDLVRDSIAMDEELTDRIAELSMVDFAVRGTVHAIDDKPIPQATHDLLNKAENQVSKSNVIAFPGWRAVTGKVRQYAAVAAVLVLALGLSVGTYFIDGNSSYSENKLAWVNVEHQLNKTPSGQTVSIDNHWDIHTKASFMNTDNNYCRLFALSSESASHMNIACQQQGGWQLHSRMPIELSDPSQYQTASVDPALDQLIDSMIQGQFLNQAQEIQAINAQWQQ